MMKDAGYRFLDHTADLLLEAWSPTKEGVFVQAARALIRVLCDDSIEVEEAKRSLSIEASDEEELFVNWLNEVLWLALGQGFLVFSAEIHFVQGGLQAVVWGKEHGENLIVTEVKSATYHELMLAKVFDGHYIARVVIDV